MKMPQRLIVLVTCITIVVLFLVVGIPVLASVFQLPSVTPIASIPNAHIVYLSDNSKAPINDFTSATRLSQQLGAQNVSSWDDVLKADQTRHIDALIIDSSALAKVDKSWSANAFRRGTVIATFNLN